MISFPCIVSSSHCI
uniref:Uncharacterized protein n=1 Tax=Moniliophthora roreri TaxID=221103 RepID=A0A0W0FXT5_MONRR